MLASDRRIREERKAVLVLRRSNHDTAAIRGIDRVREVLHRIFRDSVLLHLIDVPRARYRLIRVLVWRRRETMAKSEALEPNLDSIPVERSIRKKLKAG